MIRDIDKLYVGGVGNSKIISMDYAAPSIDSPGTIRVAFAAENNALTNVNLSVSTPVSISIGSTVLKMFPISKKRVRSAVGDNLLIVDYMDGSFILDKYFVGLKSKHFEYYGKKNYKNRGIFSGSEWNAKPDAPNGAIPENLIIVGDYIDPCKDFNLATLRDPCSTCPDTNQDAVIDCVKSRSMSILDLDYNFGDLISAIQSKGIRVRIQANYTQSYRCSYVGTLRSVLQSWCADFGFSFVYNSFGGAGYIFIYDMSAGININTRGLQNSCNVIEYTESESLEHTYSNSVIVHYAMEGQERDFNCSSQIGGRLTCRPLTLRDLVGQKPWEHKFGGPLYNDRALGQTSSLAGYDTLEMMSLLSSYSPALRDAVVWFDLYGIRRASDAEDRVNTAKVVNGINGMSVKVGGYKNGPLNGEANGQYTLPLLRTTIKKVIAKNSRDPNIVSMFSSIVDAADNTLKNMILDRENLGHEVYFFIGSVEQETAGSVQTRIREWETEIGSNFLGKYFIRKYDSTINTPPNFVCAGGDSVNFYQQGTDALDFSNIFPYANSSSYVDELSDNNTNIISDSFVLVSRSPQYAPPRGAGADVTELIKKATLCLPTQLSEINKLSSDANFVNIVNPHPESDGSWGPNDYLFLASEIPTGFKTTAATDSSKHPLEKKFGYRVSEYNTPINIGLLSLSARHFSVDGRTFWFPCQSTVREAERPKTSEVADNTNITFAGGYFVYFRNDVSNNGITFIPKSEYVVVDMPHPKNVMSLDVTFKEFNNSSINDYSIQSQDLTCVPNEGQIKQAMREYANNISLLASAPHKSIDIEMDGIPTESFSIENGLKSLAVRVGDSIRTTLTFSDFKDNKIEKNLDLKEYELKLKHKPYLQFNKTFVYPDPPSNQANQILTL